MCLYFIDLKERLLWQVSNACTGVVSRLKTQRDNVWSRTLESLVKEELTNLPNALHSSESKGCTSARILSAAIDAAGLACVECCFHFASRRVSVRVLDHQRHFLSGTTA